ncbi:hypothetical protein UlMin_034243 [Ulmus minor]
MENNGTDVRELPFYSTIKVHRLMCLELLKFHDKISQIFSAIESARPRCSSGIKALSMLQVSMDKAKLIVRVCSDSSKLYLAITGEKILSKCKKIRDALDSCLSQIQNLVPLLLAAKISVIIHGLRSAKFQLDSADSEAGNVVITLLKQDVTAASTVNNKVLEALRLAALKLNITSPFALLIEKKCIKKLLDSVKDTDPKKKKILKYLLYLLRKYGELILQCQTEGSFSQPEESYHEFIANSGSPEPPEEFKCPISSELMYDPVIIASGKTFERFWIERWLDEGNQTCPITHRKLDNLFVLPNVAVKSLISSWCLKYAITISDPSSQPFPDSHSGLTSCSTSIASFGSYMNDLHLEVSNVSIGSSVNTHDSDLADVKVGHDFNNGHAQMNKESPNVHYSANTNSNELGFLSTLANLSWGSQSKAVEDVKNKLEGHEQEYHGMNFYDIVKPLIKFLTDASTLCDAKAQRIGAEVLLAIMIKNRSEMPSFQEDAIYVLTSFLDSEITGEVLPIIEMLSCEQHCKSVMLASGILPSILKVLETQITEFQILATKILCNLTRDCDMDIGYHMVYLDYISKLVQFLDDRALAPYCIEIINNLCNFDDARVALAENVEGIASIGRLLEVDTKEEQEHALNILLLLCHEGAEYCKLVLRESIVESVLHISIIGDSRAKAIAIELLQLFKHATNGNSSKPLAVNAGLNVGISSDSKAKKSSSKIFRFLGKGRKHHFSQNQGNSSWNERWIN